ncbi:MAG: hypothetical protein JWN75_1217 [Candidatus Saccharibacteria bacterium]|nr:hypothetical protein [Candidatus Saccharibacteria bacterium]MDB5716414.1 hypothetical protein [Sphingomonadales bacterium]
MTDVIPVTVIPVTSPLNTIALVAEFQALFDKEEPIGWCIPDQRTCLLRLQLITEELSELEHALCCRDLVEVLDALTDLQYVIDGTIISCGMSKFMWSRIKERQDFNRVLRVEPPRYPDQPLLFIAQFSRSLANLTEAFSDMNASRVATHLEKLNWDLECIYADCGMIGVREDAFREVHRSNMSKLGPDGKPVTDGAGRVVKGPGYSRPDLTKFIPAPGESFTQEVSN